VACVVIGLITAATWWPRISGPIDLRWDGGAYYILGTALAEGKGYRLLSEPGNIRSTLHPPFLPAFVATHQLVLKTSDPVVVGRALRLSTALFSMAYATAIYLLLSAYIPWIYAFVTAFMAVLQPQYVYFSDSLYAETIFGLLTVLFFIVHRYSKNTLYFLLCGLCAVLAYEARTAGIALLAAWVADNVLRRDFRRTLIALGMSLLPILSWIGWIAAVESSPEYQQPAYAYQTAPYLYFNVSYARNMLTLVDPSNPQRGPLTERALMRRVWANVRAIPISIGQAVSSWAVPPYVSVPLGALVFMGLRLQLARKQYLMLMYVVLSLAAVCLTPFRMQFVRYLLPLYPFFALAMFQFLTPLVRKSGSRWLVLPTFARSAPVWLVVCVVTVQALMGLTELYGIEYHNVAYEQDGRPVKYRLFYYEPVGTAFDEALDWLKHRAERTDVIAATDPQWVYLRTGVKTVLPPFELNGKKAQQLVDTVPVKYLIAETAPQILGLGAYYRFTSALLRENPTNWNLVWRSSNDSMAIYERSTMRHAARAPK